MNLNWQLILLAFLIFKVTRGDDSRNETSAAAVDDDEEAEPAVFVADKEFVSVTFHYGQVKGYREYSSKGKPFYSYLGIPYAKPPVGALRFKDPEYPDKWEDERDGTTNPPPCPQFDLREFATRRDPSIFGDEDCLYLNVFTPQPTMDRAELPVLVYFHGGLFLSGNAKDYKPYDLLNNDVVLVVLQYRLGVLGFLSTEDTVMPGNLGLKDQTKAILWIHRNIEFFGGSPLKVTLFGSDAGAASVHFQTLTHHTIGLFTQGIMQSGTALCPWALGGVHKEAAQHLGKLLKCSKKEKSTIENDEKLVEKSNSEINDEESHPDKERAQEEERQDDLTATKEDATEAKPDETGEESPEESEIETTAEFKDEKSEANESEFEEQKPSAEKEKDDESASQDEKEEQLSSDELLDCFKNADAADLVQQAARFFMWNTLPIIFGPYADGLYIPESPEFLLRDKRHKRLDLIVGLNKDDGAWLTNSIFASEGRRVALKSHFPMVGPISLEFTDDDVAPVNMSIKAYDHYVKGLNIDAVNANNLTMLYSDRHYKVCSDLTAMYHAENNVQRKKKIYFYELKHRGERSTTDYLQMNIGKEWISQGDELFYLFPMTDAGNATRNEDDGKLSDIMTTMWRNFALTGNPTPDDSLGFQWEPFTHTEKRHLALLPEPTMEDDSREQVREFWTSLPTKQNIVFFKERFMKPKDSTAHDREDENIVKDKDSDRTEEQKEAEIKKSKENIFRSDEEVDQRSGVEEANEVINEQPPRETEVKEEL